jgi:tRNA dimethylallyltransferase
MTSTVAILIGPTASGKSALALEVARARPAVIINADAMQMYRDLHVITARPSLVEMQQADHALYGHWAAHVHGTVALWVSEAVQAIGVAWNEGKLPLLVGGTGMYIRALMEGLSPIPPVPLPAVEEVRALEARGGDGSRAQGAGGRGSRDGRAAEARRYAA